MKLVLACVVALALPGSASALTVTPDKTSVNEGNAGTVDVTFTVACELGDAGAVTYTTVDGSAPAATSGTDYNAASDTLPLPCLAPLSQQVVVQVKGDTVDELNEKFKLTATVGATTASSPDVTITDDDQPVISVGVARVVEGDSGTANAMVPIMVDQSPAQNVVVSYATQNLSATAGPDYEAKSGEVTIPAGHNASNPIEIPVAIVGDTTAEGVEGFFFTATPKDVSTADPDAGAQGAVVIFDNDTIKFSLADNARVTEGNSGTVNAIFTVTLSEPATQAMQVAWRTENWTATLADYEGDQGILKFSPGDTSKTISINVKGDLREETTELFGVFLSGPVGGEIAEGKDKALGIIDDDDKKGPKVDIQSSETDGRILKAVITCPDTVTTGCKGSLVAKRNRLKFGKGRFDIPKAGTQEVSLKMSKKAYKRLRKRSTKVKFIALAMDGTSQERKTKKKIRIPQAP